MWPSATSSVSAAASIFARKDGDAEGPARGEDGDAVEAQVGGSAGAEGDGRGARSRAKPSPSSRAAAAELKMAARWARHSLRMSLREEGRENAAAIEKLGARRDESADECHRKTPGLVSLCSA